MNVRSRLALLVALTMAELGPVACSLDFERFATDDANPGTVVAPPPMPNGGLDAASRQPDSGAIAEASIDKETGTALVVEAGCAAAAGCIDKAQSCGARCSTALVQCQKGCAGGACQRRCTTTAQTCVTQCGETCDLCVRIGGCAVRIDCLAAAQGDM
jgi:hypothetical protein